MKHDTSQMIKREEHLPVILIGEGLLVGMIGGLIVLAYRIALKYACLLYTSKKNMIFCEFP